jgi:hypothetical protein
MTDPRLDPNAVPPPTDSLDPTRDPRLPQYRNDYAGAGWGSGVALFALLAIAVLSLIWLFAGPNEPTQNTAQNDTTITQPAQPVQPAQPEQPAQNQQPAQPEQPPPPAGNNTTQP